MSRRIRCRPISQQGMLARLVRLLRTDIRNGDPEEQRMATRTPLFRHIRLSSAQLDEMIEREARALTGLSVEEAYRRIDEGTLTQPEIVEELEMLRALRA